MSVIPNGSKPIQQQLSLNSFKEADKFGDRIQGISRSLSEYIHKTPCAPRMIEGDILSESIAGAEDAAREYTTQMTIRSAIQDAYETSQEHRMKFSGEEPHPIATTSRQFEALTIPALSINEKKISQFCTQELALEQKERIDKTSRFLQYPFSQCQSVLPPKTKEVSLKILSGHSNPLETIYIERCLGQGQTGAVYKVRTHEGECYAQKTFYRGSGENREYVTMVGLDHPGIAKLLHVDQIHLYMECVDGSTLAKSDLTEKEGLAIFIQIADALSYLHDRHIAHGDFHASNIMISNDKTSIKVIDFGRAYNTNSDFDNDIDRFVTHICNWMDGWAECEEGLATHYKPDISEFTRIRLEDLFATAERAVHKSIKRIRDSLSDILYGITNPSTPLSLNHPNVMKEVKSVPRFYKKYSINEKEFIEILLQITEALSYLHIQNYVYNNSVCVDNILLTKESSLNAKLMGFGLAHRSSDFRKDIKAFGDFIEQCLFHCGHDQGCLSRESVTTKLKILAGQCKENSFTVVDQIRSVLLTMLAECRTLDIDPSLDADLLHKHKKSKIDPSEEAE